MRRIWVRRAIDFASVIALFVGMAVQAVKTPQQEDPLDA